MFLIGLSTFLLVVLMIAGGNLLNWISPDFAFNQPFPWKTTLEQTLLVYLASWLIISIHVWISARWSSFVVASAAGITATVSGVFVFGSKYAAFYPWTIPGVIGTNTLSGSALILSLLIGILGGGITFVFGSRIISRRDVI